VHELVHAHLLVETKLSRDTSEIKFF